MDLGPSVPSLSLSFLRLAESEGGGMARFLVLGLSLQGSSSYNAYCPFARYGMVGLQVATPDYFGPVRARVQPSSIGFTVFSQ